jgi:hypothetical protein
MKINGTEHHIQGMPLNEIAQLLLDSSPTKDGLGIHAVLRVREHLVFETMFGHTIGRGLFDYIERILESRSEDPGKISFNYNGDSRTFSTCKKID